MPNVVLEMSQHALPMILADVGGLYGTFNEPSVRFVDSRQSVQDSAMAFCNAMDSILKLSISEVEDIVEAARGQAIERHGAVSYLDNVCHVFDIKK